MCGEANERIDEGVFQWFGHVERMENDRIAKRAYVDECAGSHSVGKPWKKWIDAVKDCLKKRGLEVRQARRMVHDIIAWWKFVRWNEPLNLTGCYSCELPQIYDRLEELMSICGQAHNLKA